MKNRVIKTTFRADTKVAQTENINLKELLNEALKIVHEEETYWYKSMKHSESINSPLVKDWEQKWMTAMDKKFLLEAILEGNRKSIEVWAK